MEVSHFARNNFTQTFLSQMNLFDNVDEALRTTFLKIDELMTSEKGIEELSKLIIKSNDEDDKMINNLPINLKVKENNSFNKQIEGFKELFDPRCQERCEVANYSGSTACVCVIIEEKVYLANAGDSRAIVIKEGIIVKKTTDHKPELEEEKKRVLKAEGWISENRVKGNLNLTRSLGDLDYKNNKKLPPEDQIITANPEIITIDRKQCDLIVIACDGIWDTKNSEKVSNYILTRIKEKKNLTKIVEELMNDCLTNDPSATNGVGSDNMSCIIIDLTKKN